ncbi:valine--tRNA ligase, partial [Patescibacteria group bacterium]
DRYGTDALRVGLASQATGLQDIRFGEGFMVMGKKFANKVWNISRYILLKLGDISWEIENPHNEMSAKIDGLAINVTQQIKEYNFAEATNLLYHFIWHDFADKFIEESKGKDDKETSQTLIHTLTTILKLLHPFMPFVTEELWSQLPLKNKKLLLIEDWPVPERA